MTPTRRQEIKAMLEAPAHRQCQQAWQDLCRELFDETKGPHIKASAYWPIALCDDCAARMRVAMLRIDDDE